MGLDVTAYSKVRKAENQALTEDHEALAGDNAVIVVVNDNFGGSCDEFPNDTVVIVDGETYADFGRSYGGYNFWRNQLAELAGYPLTECEGYWNPIQSFSAGAWAVESGPFWELINFSDCEGCLGTAICKKLAKDFADYQEKADSHQDKLFKSGYAEMRKSFEIGADDGFVSFH